MRETLFRGKRIDNGEWVYGGYYVVPDGEGGAIHRIAECDCERFMYNDIVVDPTTIGQYTGLTDKNGKKIFEGDIIFDSETEENHFVEFDEGGFCAGDMFLQAYISFGEFDSEIIGNIHDNPELREVKE